VIRKILRQVKLELRNAKRLHPADSAPWNERNLVGMAAVVSCEAGEVMQGAIKLQYEDVGAINYVRTELLQTAATAIRLIEVIDSKRF